MEGHRAGVGSGIQYPGQGKGANITPSLGLGFLEPLIEKWRMGEVWDHDKGVLRQGVATNYLPVLASVVV